MEQIGLSYKETKMSYNIPLNSSGDVDFAGTMTANAFVGDGSGLTNLPSGGGVDTGADYTWSGDHIFEQKLKFNDLYSEAGGSFKFYNLGTEGDVDTEFLHLFAVTNSFYLQPNSTGSGSGRDFFITGDNSVGGGHIQFTNTGGIQLKFGSNTNIELTNTSVTIGRNIQPDANNSWTNGTSSLRWSTGYFNNLDATRLKSNFWDGTGSNMFIVNPADTPLYLSFNDNTSYAISSSELIPWTNNSKDLGSTTKRWANVNTVDLNASGDVVMAANVDFTGLPTTDPLLAGRMWNDSGNPKISAG